MPWAVEYHDDYLRELYGETEAVQDEVFAAAGLLQQLGPNLRRPYSDTLNGSHYPNMKELRFTLPDGEWRVAYAFNPARQAIPKGGSKNDRIP